MIPNHRLLDLALGVSVIGWSIAGVVSHAGRLPVPVLLGTSLLHLTVGVLFWVRSREARSGSLPSCLAAIPAVLVGGWVFSMAPAEWSVLAQGLFLTGSVFAVVSFLFLGRCFAVLPAIRGTVTRGPFRLVRHPAYLGELTMVLACLMTLPAGLVQIAALCSTLAFFVARIHAEERLLSTGVAYRQYCRSVRWRLIPRVW